MGAYRVLLANSDPKVVRCYLLVRPTDFQDSAHVLVFPCSLFFTSFLPCYYVSINSCCFNAQMLGTMFVHDHFL